MKRPIDPNLNNTSGDDFLIDVATGKNDDFGFNDYRGNDKNNPDFVVTETEEAVGKIPGAMASSSSSDGEHHHHSSSGSSHHHSSSGSSHHHHSSSGSSHHHSSSGSSHHHSSSGSSHHSSSSKSKSRRSKSKKSKMPLAGKIAIAIVSLIVLAALVVFGTFFFLKSTGHKDIMPASAPAQEIIEYNGHKYKYNKDIFAVGFIGVDQRELKTKDSADYVGAADTDIVAAVNSKTGEAKVIAIPRDTMVDVDVTSKSGLFLRTEKKQLCLSYAYGGGGESSCNSTLKSMSRVLLGVPIEKYYALDLDGISAMNDAIGGVTVDSLYDFKDLGISKGEKVTLMGDKAESYVRVRDMDNINASLNRTERQVQYIKAYAAQAVPAIVKDFSVVRRLYDTASEYSETNITLSNVTYAASFMLSKGTTEFETYTIKGEMKSSEVMEWADVVHAEFEPDEDSVMEIVLDVFYTQID